jgi:hypothetical protein
MLRERLLCLARGKVVERLNSLRDENAGKLFFNTMHGTLIPVSLAHVVSSLAYPNLLGTKRLGCCCCNARNLDVCNQLQSHPLVFFDY